MTRADAIATCELAMTQRDGSTTRRVGQCVGPVGYGRVAARVRIRTEAERLGGVGRVHQVVFFHKKNYIMVHLHLTHPVYLWVRPCL